MKATRSRTFNFKLVALVI